MGPIIAICSRWRIMMRRTCPPVQAKAQEEMVGTLRRQLADAEGARASLSETLAEVRSANRSLEARLGAAAAEVDKGNQIIDRLQADLKARRRSGAQLAVAAGRPRPRPSLLPPTRRRRAPR